MRKWTVLLLTLNACGPDAFVTIPLGNADAGDAAPIDGRDAAPDAELEAATDAPSSDASKDADAACELSGSLECGNVVAAYCARYASCCQQFPGNGKCSVGFDMVATCKASLTQNGFDCNSGKYNRAVCSSSAACAASAQGAACNAMFLSSGPSDAAFASCPGFWGQF